MEESKVLSKKRDLHRENTYTEENPKIKQSIYKTKWNILIWLID